MATTWEAFTSHMEIGVCEKESYQIGCERIYLYPFIVLL